jgi:hypothetical protein
LVAPVVLVGVDVVAAEELVVGFADHGDGGGGDQDQHWGVGVGDADAEVVESAAVAQGAFATVSWRMRKWPLVLAMGWASGRAWYGCAGVVATAPPEPGRPLPKSGSPVFGEPRQQLRGVAPRAIAR